MDFSAKLQDSDPRIFDIIQKEEKRQFDNIELIASENYASKAVIEAQGTILTNKYAEGYPGRRFYNGCEYVDEIEDLATWRLSKLFNCKFANVQPHSGSQANQAVFLSTIKPGDTILGMSLDSGGHLTHGSPANLSGKWFNSVFYNVNRESYLIDYDNIEYLAKKHHPKLIICGYSAYPRKIDFAKFREIADKVGAYLLADVSHISGLIVAGAHENPFPHAHIVTSTTHKTLRGPRGGVIMTNDEDLAKKIDSSIFPGIQGGPLMHVIAAKAVAFNEASSAEYKVYIKNVCDNAKSLASRLKHNGFNVLTGGTDNHLLLVDLRNFGLTGKKVAHILDQVSITCNKNAIPFDNTSPFVTSGIRVGTPASTTRGFGKEEFDLVADLMKEAIELRENEQALSLIKRKVNDLCRRFPIFAR
ncbi:MAG: serine hydroxymethyltransferase [Rickettsiaceae bacterium]|nr:serine hydroxymethyltransferase [Rickettsiaceae bacterium]